jgi:hypothetical protein
VGAFVAAVAGFLGVGASEPIDGEHVLAAFPRAVF